MKTVRAARALLRALAGLSLAGAAGGCYVVNDIPIVNDVLGSDKRDVYKYDHPFPVDDPEFRRSAETLGSPMVGGNAADIFVNGDRIFPAMTRDIREAKRSVNLETYIFQPDEAGRLFADAMIAAARRGVKVRLLVDSWGSSLKALKDEMEAAGVSVKKYRPLRVFAIHKVGKRTHRKILVVDGRIAWTGGLGIDKRWMGDARNTNEWRDTQVRVVGPVAAQMQSIFSDDWTFTTGEILTGTDFYPPIAPAGKILAQAIKASRGDASSLAKMFYFIAIKSARRSIDIANAYFLPDHQVQNALVEAVRRGVSVQVMVPGRHIDLPMVREASWHGYGKLLEGGVRIYEYVPTMMHNKIMIIDGLYATVGSINFDARSMNRNAEESLAFYDRGFAARLEAVFEQDKKRCKEITLAVWNHRGFPKRASELVSFLFAPYY